MKLIFIIRKFFKRLYMKKENLKIKDILLDIDARISHIEDTIVDYRQVLIKLVKQNNNIVEFLRDLDFEYEATIENVMSPDKQYIKDNNINTDKFLHISKLIDEFMKKNKDLEELEEELKKYKDDLTPGTVGES